MDKECRKYTLTGGSTQMIGKRNVCNVSEVSRKKNKEMKRKNNFLNQNGKVEIVRSIFTAT